MYYAPLPLPKHTAITISIPRKVLTLPDLGGIFTIYEALSAQPHAKYWPVPNKQPHTHTNHRRSNRYETVCMYNVHALYLTSCTSLTTKRSRVDGRRSVGQRERVSELSYRITIHGILCLPKLSNIKWYTICEHSPPHTSLHCFVSFLDCQLFSGGLSLEKTFLFWMARNIVCADAA